MKGIGNLSLMVSFFEGVEVRTHAPRKLFIKDHEHRRRVGAHTSVNNTCVEKVLSNFLNFIFWGKGVTIGTNIWRKVF
jgi:hypothetical protein